MIKIFIFAVIMAFAKAPEKTVIKVNGMVCSFCAQGIEKKFKAREEISAVSVDLDTKTVDLQFKDGKIMSDDEIKKMIQASGYDVVSIQKESGK
ncbi:MAG: cation transporter [Bdellovibrionales bacterium]|nr:cation transporter [Bdellovibrionales bacterium]